jgi:hypothetical protein
MWEHMLGAVSDADRNNSIPQDERHEPQVSYQEMVDVNKKLIAEVAKERASLYALQRENEYLMATLHDIREGLDAMAWHLKIATSSDDGNQPGNEFTAAYTAIKLTHGALRNIIDEWESKWVLTYDEIPF